MEAVLWCLSVAGRHFAPINIVFKRSRVEKKSMHDPRTVPRHILSALIIVFTKSEGKS